MTIEEGSRTRKEAIFLSEARKFLDAALMEFEKGVKEGKDETIRDAAEKAWNATIQATTALLLAKGYSEEDIKTYRQKRLTLLSAKDDNIKQLA